MNQSEQMRNLALVEDLCRIWEAPGYTAEALLPFFADDCMIRFMDSLPFAVGHQAVLEQARSLMPLGTERMRVRFINVQATGSMVISHRVDTLIVPGKDDVDFEMLGVFRLTSGKIREWTDFMLTPYTVLADGTVQVG